MKKWLLVWKPETYRKYSKRTIGFRQKEKNGKYIFKGGNPVHKYECTSKLKVGDMIVYYWVEEYTIKGIYKVVEYYYDKETYIKEDGTISKWESPIQFRIEPIIELEKALVMAGIKPHSMLGFRKNFVIGRALSLQDGVYDTRGKDFQLQVEYQETAPPEKNKLWNVWAAHLRRIVISGNAISVVI